MLENRLQECVKPRSYITDISLLKDNTLVFCTEFHGAKIIQPNECKTLKNLSIEHLGHKTTARAFSKAHKLLAFANGETIYIINLQNKTILQRIQTSDGIIELLSFVEDSPYIVAGTKDGRVTQYRYDGRSQLSRLCSFPTKRDGYYSIKNNYVSAVAFLGNLMAVSGYGGNITLLKMNSLAAKRSIEGSHLRINALLFLDKEYLLSGAKDGIVRIHSISSEKETRTINTPFTNIRKFIKMPNSDFVLVLGDLNSLALINVQTAKLVTKAYLSFQAPISDIVLDDLHRLFIALESKEFYSFALPDAQEIKEHILFSRLDEAFALIEADPMLQGTKEHKRLEVLYEKLYAQAIEALIHSQKNQAYKLMETFMGVASKKKEVAAIFKDFEHYPRFKLLVAQQKYPLAYVMSEKFPSLRRTQQFKKMESHFIDAFTFAQKQILIGREDVAHETLMPYSAVASKKQMITLLLKQNRDFVAFLRAIQEKNYLLMEQLLEKNELFEQIPTYTALKVSEQNALDKIANLINHSKLPEALKAIEALQHTPGIESKLKEFQRVIELVTQLKKSYKDGNFLHCYELIDKHYVLNDIELSELLESEWTKLMSECEAFALQGDIKSIKERLGVLIGVKTRLAKVGDLLRVSFHSKIKGLLAKRSFTNAENIIYSYIDIFGTDSEIESLGRICEKLSGKKLAFTHDERHRVDRDDWIKSPLIMTPSNLQ